MVYCRAFNSLMVENGVQNSFEGCYLLFWVGALMNIGIDPGGRRRWGILTFILTAVNIQRTSPTSASRVAAETTSRTRMKTYLECVRVCARAHACVATSMCVLALRLP